MLHHVLRKKQNMHIYLYIIITCVFIYVYIVNIYSMYVCVYKARYKFVYTLYI